jgi:hypothetical protein
MKTVSVQLVGVASSWTKPCQNAVAHLNDLFRRNNISVALATAGPQEPAITVRTDGSIPVDAVHGRTSATSNGGKLVRADVRLPTKVTINSPQGIRDAGPGILEVIAAHEFVHALGHSDHTSLLMSQTMYKELGDNASGDKLKTAGGTMPPLRLSPESVSTLKMIWN